MDESNPLNDRYERTKENRNDRNKEYNTETIIKKKQHNITKDIEKRKRHGIAKGCSEHLQVSMSQGTKAPAQKILGRNLQCIML